MKTKAGTTELERDVDRLSAVLEVLGRRSSLRDPIASAVESMGLTPPQLHAVMWLGRDGPLTMGTLAQRVGVTEKTVTGLVDRLEREGYVVRERDASDRRVVHVVLSRKGATVARKLTESFRRKMLGFLGLLDQGDREDLFRILGVLLASLEGLDPNTSMEVE